MSTIPGDDALRDAGLLGHDPDEAVNLVDEIERPVGLPDPETGGAPRTTTPGPHARTGLAAPTRPTCSIRRGWCPGNPTRRPRPTTTIVPDGTGRGGTVVP